MRCKTCGKETIDEEYCSEHNPKQKTLSNFNKKNKEKRKRK